MKFKNLVLGRRALGNSCVYLDPFLDWLRVFIFQPDAHRFGRYFHSLQLLSSVF